MFPLFCLTVLVLTASSARTQDVRYQFDDTVDFSKFKTYKWVALASPAPIDKLTDEQVKAALDAGFSQKGLTKVAGDTAADLFIAYQTAELKEHKFDQFNSGWGLGPGWNGTSADMEAVIYKGELVVNMYDPATRHLIWMGVATKTLDMKANAEKRQKDLNRAVTKLMQNYPPPVAGRPTH
jgi:hypothetical protein